MPPRIVPLLALLAASTLETNPAGVEDRARPAITALALVPGGSGWLRGSQAGVTFHPGRRDGRERPVPAGLDHVHALAFSPDGATLALAGGSPAESGAVELRAWPGGDLLGILEGHEDVVYDVAWLAEGRALATAGADRVVRIWDARSRRPLATLAGHSGPVLALAASPDGRWLCSGGADATIRVWEAGSWRSTRSLTNHLGPVHGLTFRPTQLEGRPATLASAGGDGTVRIWQPGTGRLVRIVRHPAPVLCVAWDEDGSHLVTGARDGCIRVVDGDSDIILAEQHLTDDWITGLVVPPRGAPLIAGDSRGAVLSWSYEARAGGGGRDAP